jgi:hypothetical protein
VIVGLITGVLLMESYGAMVTAARAGGRAIPELWPLGTEALALAMEVSVLEAKRLHHRAVLRLSWLLLVALVALSTPLQVAVAPAGRRCWAQRQLRPRPGRPVPRPIGNGASAQWPPARHGRDRYRPRGQAMTDGRG